MFKGENRARGYEDQAKATLFEGDSKKSASQLSALGTIIGGAGSMYGQYNKLPPRVAYG
jgi:hypothetical protein